MVKISEQYMPHCQPVSSFCFAVLSSLTAFFIVLLVLNVWKSAKIYLFSNSRSPEMLFNYLPENPIFAVLKKNL